MNPLRKLASHVPGVFRFRKQEKPEQSSAPVIHVDPWNEEPSLIRQAVGLGGTEHRGLALLIEPEPPPEVMTAVHTIANETQHGFINTWLPDLVERDRRPIVRNEKDEALLDLILAYRDRCIRVAPSGETRVVLDEKARHRLDAARRMLASSKLQYEVYDHRTEKARSIFKAILLASGAGFLLAQFAPALVHTAEAFGDDIFNWIAEMVTVRSTGMSKREIAASQFPAVGAFIGVQQLTHGIYGALEKGTASPVVLGAKYGMATTLVSLAAMAGTWVLMSRRYGRLMREGKVPVPKIGRWKKVRTFLHAAKEAGKQSMKYPAVPGILLGALVSVAAGAILGPLPLPHFGGIMLQNPLFLAVVGIIETVGAYLSTTFHGKIAQRHLNARLRKLATTGIAPYK